MLEQLLRRSHQCATEGGFKARDVSGLFRAAVSLSKLVYGHPSVASKPSIKGRGVPKAGYHHNRRGLAEPREFENQNALSRGPPDLKDMQSSPPGKQGPDMGAEAPTISRISYRWFVRGLVETLLLGPGHQSPPLAQYKTSELVQLVWSLSKLPDTAQLLPQRWLSAAMSSFAAGQEGSRRIDAANSQVGGGVVGIPPSDLKPILKL